MSRFAGCGGLSGFRVWAAALALPSAASSANVSSSRSTGEEGDRCRLFFSSSFSQSSSSVHLLPGQHVPCSKTARVSPSALEGGSPSAVGTASQQQRVCPIPLIKEHRDPFALDRAVRRKKTRVPFSPRESHGATSCQTCCLAGECTGGQDTKVNPFRTDCSSVTTTGNKGEKQYKRGDRMNLGGKNHRKAVGENLCREGVIRTRRQRTDTLRDVQDVPLSRHIRHPSTYLPSLAVQLTMKPLSPTIAACKEPLPSSGFEPSSAVVSSTVPSWFSTVSSSRSPSPFLDSPTPLHTSSDPDLAAAVHRAVEGLRVRQKNERKHTEGNEDTPTDAQSSPLISHPLVIPHRLLRRWRGLDKGEENELQASSRSVQRLFSSTPSCSSVVAGETRARVPLPSSLSHVEEPRPREEGTERTMVTSEMSGDSDGDKPLPSHRKLSLNEPDFAHLETRWLKFLERSRPYGHLSTGNSVKIYDNGDKAFTAMLRSIKNAKKNVLMETYIFDQSQIGQAVKDALCEAALRGCFVLLVVDWLGGFSMPRSWHDELLASGVRLVIFNPPLPVLLRTTLGGEDSSSSSATLSRSSSSFSHAIATAKLALVYCKHRFSTLFSTSSSHESSPLSLSLPSSSSPSSPFLLDSSAVPPSAPSQDLTHGTEPGLPLCAERVGPIPFRDHRKSLVIDGEVAFVGSLNVSEDAVGERYGGRQRFYDLHVRVRGPAAKQVQALVLETLATANARKIAGDLLTHLTRQEERDENFGNTYTVVNEPTDTSQVKTRDTFVIVRGGAVHEEKLRRVHSPRGDGLAITREEETSREGSEIGRNGQTKEEKMEDGRGVGDEQVMDEEEAARKRFKHNGEERTRETEEQLEGESEAKHGKVQKRGRMEREAGKEGEGGVDLLEEKMKETLGEPKKIRLVPPHCQRQRDEDVKGENLYSLERSSISHSGDSRDEGQRFQGVPILSASSAVTTLFSSLFSYVFRSKSPHSSVSSSSPSSRSSTPGDPDSSLLSPVPAGGLIVSSTSPYLSPSGEERERAAEDPGEKPNRPMTPTKKLLETPRRLLFSWMAIPSSKETASSVDSIEAKRREEQEQDDDIDDAHDVLIQVLESNVLRNQRSIQAVLKNAIYNATVSLYVTTSYFVPPGFLRRALQAALARDGVDVFLLLSGDSDVWGDVYATTYVVRKFLSKKRRHSFLTADWEVDPSVTRKITAFFSSLLPTNRWNSPEAYYDLFQAGSEDEREPEESPPPLPAVGKFAELSRALGPVTAEAPAILDGADPGFSSRRDEKRRGLVVGMEEQEQELQGAQQHGEVGPPRARGSLLPASQQTQKNPIEFEDANPTVSLPGAAEQTPTSSSSFFSPWKPMRRKGSQMNDTSEGERGEDDARTSLSTRDVWQAQQFWRALRDRQEPRGEACVYFLASQHCHAKNIVVDHVWSTVGSFNFDRFSSRRNMEVVLAFLDPTIAEKFEKLYWKQVYSNGAEQMTVEKWNDQSFIKKVCCFLCYYVTRFAGKNFFDGLSDQRKRAVLNRLVIASYLEDMPATNLCASMAWGLQ